MIFDLDIWRAGSSSH